jgi:hypothetical protein
VPIPTLPPVSHDIPPVLSLTFSAPLVLTKLNALSPPLSIVPKFAIY